MGATGLGLGRTAVLGVTVEPLALNLDGRPKQAVGPDKGHKLVPRRLLGFVRLPGVDRFDLAFGHRGTDPLSPLVPLGDEPIIQPVVERRLVAIGDEDLAPSLVAVLRGVHELARGVVVLIGCQSPVAAILLRRMIQQVHEAAGAHQLLPAPPGAVAADRTES